MIRAALLLWIALAAPGFGFPIERCVNLSNALEAPNEGEWGYRIRDKDIASIAADGFDAIRFPVRFSAWMSEGRLSPELLKRVDHVIRTALDHELTVILDLHHFHELSENPKAHADQRPTFWRGVAGRSPPTATPGVWARPQKRDPWSYWQ